jgi:hypothetical protein
MHSGQVLRDFRAPEGTAPGDLDAGGDGEVLAVLDLRIDDSLQARALQPPLMPARDHSMLLRQGQPGAPAALISAQQSVWLKAQQSSLGVIFHRGRYMHPQRQVDCLVTGL